jgi:hypothetical protein
MEHIDVTNVTRKSIVPGPIRHESDYERFHHRDLAQLTPADAWAELELARMELARRVFERRTERIIGFDRDHCPVGDQEWLRQRIAALSHHLDRRTAA